MLGRNLMMATRGISVAATSTGAATSSSTLSIDKPSGVGTGTLLIAFIVAGTSGTTITPPSGWAELVDANGRGVYTRTVADGEADSYTWTMKSAVNSRGFIVAVANGKYDTIGAFGSASNPAVAASATAAAANSLAFAFFSENEDSSLTYSTPSGWNAVTSDSDATSPSAAIFSKAVNAGATGAASSTSTPTSTSRGIQIIVRPR